MEQLISSIGSALTAAGAVAWGVASAGPWEISPRYAAFLERGDHGALDYLARHYALKSSGEAILPGATRVIAVAFPYGLAAVAPGAGSRVAGYAWGEDYHTRVGSVLDGAGALLQGFRWRRVVDSAPLPERFVASQAGLGFIGRSGNLIVPGAGPTVVLGFILTNAPLPLSAPMDHEGCGDCRACVEACPGGALHGDGTMDVRRCLSYYTTEARELPPDELALRYGGRIFGCEECVAACPHTVARPPLGEDPLPPALLPRLAELAFGSTFKGTAINHLSRTKLLTSFAYTLLIAEPSFADAMLERLSREEHPLIKEALEQIKRLADTDKGQ